MEEAEALSSKMGIMVQGGVFTCFGGAQHIKDKFGSGYEIELKFNNNEQHNVSRSMKEHNKDIITQTPSNLIVLWILNLEMSPPR